MDKHTTQLALCFFNDTATTEIYTLSLHDALPIFAHATYCGEVTMVDFWIGRLLAKLDALNLRDNTVVLFTSDHGFYFGEHGYFGRVGGVIDREVSGMEDSSLPEWLPGPWFLPGDRSPLFRDFTIVPLIVDRKRTRLNS